MDTYPCFILDDERTPAQKAEAAQASEEFAKNGVSYGDLHDMYYPDVVPADPEPRVVKKASLMARFFKRKQ